MSRLSRVSEISEDSTTSSGKAPNFSRPRPQSYNSEEYGIKDRHRYSNVHSISAFHEPNRDLPDEPRFSEESERTQTTTSDNSAGSEFAWDGARGELVSRPRKREFDEQRHPGKPRSRPTTAKTTKSDTNTPAFANARPSQAPQRVSADAQSDAMSLTTNDQFEDTRSHHTVSGADADDDAGSFDEYGEWRSSDYDTSGLSDAKIKKLLKKGVNPSLYAEMQAAKKKSKSKWIGPLVGNSFIA